jgi:hypothetical protein
MGVNKYVAGGAARWTIDEWIAGVNAMSCASSTSRLEPRFISEGYLRRAAASFVRYDNDTRTHQGTVGIPAVPTHELRARYPIPANDHFSRRTGRPECQQRHPVCTAVDRRFRSLYSLTCMVNDTSEGVRPAGLTPAGSTSAEPHSCPDDGDHLKIQRSSYAEAQDGLSLR